MVTRRAHRCYVVFCHPRHDSLAHAALERALTGLEVVGGRRGSEPVEVRVSDLYADGFVAEMSLDERRRHATDAAPAASLTTYVEHLRWCDALVLVYPTWFGSPPAMLLGWLDRVMVQGVAWRLPPGGRHLRGLLRHIRSITVVTTHGSPKSINVLQGEPGKRIWFRAIRALCHPWTRCRWVALYGVDRSDAAGRRAFLERVERTLARI